MFGNFEWDPESVPTLKLGFHIAQVVFAFIAFVLEIVVFRDDAALINSNNGWPFGVVRHERQEKTPNMMANIASCCIVLPFNPSMDLPDHGTAIPADTETGKPARHGYRRRALHPLLAHGLRQPGGIQRQGPVRERMWAK